MLPCGLGWVVVSGFGVASAARGFVCDCMCFAALCLLELICGLEGLCSVIGC